MVQKLLHLKKKTQYNGHQVMTDPGKKGSGYATKNAINRKNMNPENMSYRFRVADPKLG